MTLKENQRLVRAGQMPLRAPDGKQLAAVPVYKVVLADDVSEDSAAELKPNERLVLVGVTESKAAAEERYKALITGEMPPKSSAALLYIKDTVDSANLESELTEGEKRALNPLVAELGQMFAAAMREREKLERKSESGVIK